MRYKLQLCVPMWISFAYDVCVSGVFDEQAWWGQVPPLGPRRSQERAQGRAQAASNSGEQKQQSWHKTLTSKPAIIIDRCVRVCVCVCPLEGATHYRLCTIVFAYPHNLF